MRINAFDWKKEFKKIMDAGGFDAVIGNPPYRMLQPHNTEKQVLKYLRNTFLVAEFKIEMFHMFLQCGISRVKKDGYLGFIVPTTILNTSMQER